MWTFNSSTAWACGVKRSLWLAGWTLKGSIACPVVGRVKVKNAQSTEDPKRPVSHVLFVKVIAALDYKVRPPFFFCFTHGGVLCLAGPAVFISC